MGNSSAIGEVIGGNLSSLDVALTHQEVVKDTPLIGLGDYVGINLRERIRVIGVVGSIGFEGYRTIQPLGMPTDVRESVMPDLEDVVYSSVIKKAVVPVLGFFTKGTPIHALPKYLPEIHDIVEILPKNEIRDFHTVEGKFQIGYMSRLLREDIVFPTDLISYVYKTLHSHFNLSERDFLESVKRGFLEARGIDIPAAFASDLNKKLLR